MTDTIKEIFDIQFDLNTTIPSEGLDIYKKHEELMDEIEERLDRKTTEKLRSQIFDLSRQTSFEWFREGFHFGATLMLELFSPQHRVQ